MSSQEDFEAETYLLHHSPLHFGRPGIHLDRRLRYLGEQCSHTSSPTQLVCLVREAMEWALGQPLWGQYKHDSWGSSQVLLVRLFRLRVF